MTTLQDSPLQYQHYQPASFPLMLALWDQSDSVLCPFRGRLFNPTADEYVRYIAQPQVPSVKQGYKWWLGPTQQKNYPNSSKMALDMLSIPAMSADPEHLFLGAKITISDRRNRLGYTQLRPWSA